MTHQTQTNHFDSLVELLADQGFDGMARAITLLFNEAMKLERTEALGAAPYQRSEHRRGYANGYKPKTLRTRVGEITVDVPQTRGLDFYPSTLERGERSERALKLFPNDDSLLRLVSAVLIEISEDWETAKIYLNTETD